MAKPQRDEKSLNVLHEHKAVKGDDFTPVFLRVKYEKRNMEAFLSSVGISQERLEFYEQDALYDALEWAEDHPGEEEVKAGDVLMESFCGLLKEAEHPMQEPFSYGLKIRRRGQDAGVDEDLTYYSISL